MRVQKYTLNDYVTLPPGYGGMGFPWPTDMLIPAPPRPLFAGFGAFGGEWEDWCDKNYYTSENNTKCKNCNKVDFPIIGPKCTYPEPKTVWGRKLRGLPQQTDLERLGPPGGTVEPFPDTPPPEATESWFEKNKMLVIAGGGVALLGIVAFAMRGKRGGFKGFFGLGGYKARKKRRSTRGRR